MAEGAASSTRMSSWQRWTMVAVALGSGVVFLDTSIVNLALPTIAEELESPLFSLAPLEAQSYIGASYFVTLSALLILAGGLADFFGRARMFRLGLVGFLVTSILCGLAPNMELLILFRILQGAAGALVVPGSLAIITASFEGEQQGRAFGVWAGASAAATILGPFVGGVLVNSISWRAAFFINVPLLLVSLYAMRHVPESRDEQSTGRFDWLGSLVVVLAVAGLAFGVIRGEQTQWQGVEAFLALAVGAVATIAFPVMMVKRENPLVPPSLFKSRNFTVTNLSTFVIYGALYVFLAFQGLFLIGTLGYNEQAAAVASIPATLFLVFFSTRFGKLAARYGPRLFMATGPFVMGLGLLWLTRFPADSEPWILGWPPSLPPGGYFVDLLPSLLVFGSGLTMMVAPLTTALMTSVPKHNSGVASAINNAISRVGAPLVTALIFVAVVSSFYAGIKAAVPSVNTSSPEFREQVAPLNVRKLVETNDDPALVEAARTSSTDAFHLAAIVAAALMFAGAAVNGFGIRNPERRPEPAAGAAPPPRVDKIPEEVPCLPVLQPTAIPGDARMHAEPGET